MLGRRGRALGGVDDKEAITAEPAPILEQAGFIVAVARDGEAGLRRVEAFGPDLIVLDVLMPGLSGREVSRRLQVMGNWMPIVMLTQIGTASARSMSLEEGANDYLNTPFDLFELIAWSAGWTRAAPVSDTHIACGEGSFLGGDPRDPRSFRRSSSGTIFRARVEFRHRYAVLGMQARIDAATQAIPA
jgi:DNA-binding response OmpR family regulator